MCNNVYAQKKKSKTQEPGDLVNSLTITDQLRRLNEAKVLYEQQPGNPEHYLNYYQLLIQEKEYQQALNLAEKIWQDQAEPIYLVDQIHALRFLKQDKKAEDLQLQILQRSKGNDGLILKIAQRLETHQRIDDAIQLLEQARTVTMDPIFYAAPLGRLYAKTDKTDKAIELLIEASMAYREDPQALQSQILEVIQDDPAKHKLAQAALLRKVTEFPQHQPYVVILTWLYTVKGDWDGALLQVRSLDLRNKENGSRLIEFAQDAAINQQWEVAQKALQFVLQKDLENAIKKRVLETQLDIAYQQCTTSLQLTKEQIDQTLKLFTHNIAELPQFYGSEMSIKYATLLGQYFDQIPQGISVLEQTIEAPGARRDIVAQAKLLLGDYYIIQDKVWDATLVYSQVDKEFKEDALGEEARYRNAKLAYYRGDFDWAQAQLKVLKSFTSELMANDALYLSVLITENIPADSNLVPLQEFAKADLLLFQNKMSDALKVLNDIQVKFPQHPLNDDIWLLKSRIALKQHQPIEAIKYLEEILKGFKEDVLADDATFRIAEIYERYLNNSKEAKKYYEDLILNFSGSTYTQEARKRLQNLAI